MTAEAKLNPVTGTYYHVGYEIGSLFRKSDAFLATLLCDATTGRALTSDEARAFFREEWSAGRTFWVAGHCDNRNPAGRCMGHEELP